MQKSSTDGSISDDVITCKIEIVISLKSCASLKSKEPLNEITFLRSVFTKLKVKDFSNRFFSGFFFHCYPLMTSQNVPKIK